MKTVKELMADYNFFIASIPNYLDKLSKLMGLQVITYSFEEIDHVRVFYETNYKFPEKLGISYDELVYLFYAYIGEAFILRHGGNWELSKMKNDELTVHQ